VQLRGFIERRKRSSGNLDEFESPERFARVQIIDQAVPPIRPTRPNRPLNMVLGALGGGFLGIITAGVTALFLRLKKPRVQLTAPPSGSRPEKAQTRKGILPTLILHAVILLVITVFFVKVMPTFSEIFAGFGAKLSTGTAFVIAVSKLFQSWWALLIPFVLGVDLIGCLMAQRYGGSRGRRWWSGAVGIGLFLILALSATTLFRSWLNLSHNVVQTAQASTETWSPKLAPGEKPDVDKIWQEASDLRKQGHYEESLQRHIWYHNHALEYGVGQTGVRLSFALSDWVELGRRYPKAKEALVEIRDAKTRELAEGRGHGELFQDVARLNDYLQNREATFELFKNIQQHDPALARQCYFYAEDLLVEKGEYELCYGYMGDPQRRFEVIRSGWEIEKQRYQRQAESRKQHPQPGGLPSPADMTREVDKRFVKNVGKLIEILVGDGHRAEAEAIRDQATKLLDDPGLKSAVGDVEEKIRYKLVQNSSGKSSVQPAVFKPSAGRVKSDYIGQTWFPEGDSIEISSVERNENQITVKGHYNLVSHDHALLGLYCTPTNKIDGHVPVDPTQRMQINRGKGEFDLSCSHPCPGLHHVSMYADGHSFAAIYFGTKEETDSYKRYLSDCQKGLETNALTFGPVIERILPMDKDGLTELFDFERNEATPDPKPGDTAAGIAQLTKRGLVIRHDKEKHKLVYLGRSGVVVARTRVPNELWDKLSYTDIISVPTYPPGPGVTSSVETSDDLPQTIFFKTGASNLGVLQITGFTENPRGVKLRYKLVQNEVEKSPQPMPTRPTAAAVYDSIKDIQKSFAHRMNEPEIRKTVLNEIAAKLEEFQNLVRGTEVQPLLDHSGELTREVVNLKDQTRIAEIQKELIEIDRKIGELVHRPTFPTAGPTRVTMPPQKLSSDAVLNESPKLRFIAWQDEWKTNQPGAARHPDGSAVTNVTELGWLRAVPPLKDSRGWAMMETNCRALHLWFSHPQFDEKSLNEISLLDYRGFRIQHGRIAAGCRRANEKNGNLGWLLHTVLVTNTLTRATVRLYFTTGSLERTFDIHPNQKGILGLEDGGYSVVGLGQSADGKAFVSFAVDSAKMPSREVGVVAVTRDNRELPYRGWEPPGVENPGPRTGRFEFDVPLSEVEKFRIGTRPIRTNEWKHVVLPGN
jgi:hypothetical protein